MTGGKTSVVISKHPPRNADGSEIDFTAGIQHYRKTGLLLHIIGAANLATMILPPADALFIAGKAGIAVSLIVLGLRWRRQYAEALRIRRDGFTMGELQEGEVIEHSKKFVLWGLKFVYVARVHFRRTDGLSYRGNFESFSKDHFTRFPLHGKASALVDYENRTCFFPESAGLDAQYV